MKSEILKSQPNKVEKKKKNYVDPIKFKELILEYYDSDDFSEELGVMINKISEHVAYMPNFINYCVDDETEALTYDGWKKYDEITTSDLILSYDVDNKDMKWSSIKEIFINKNYNDLMHSLKIKGLNALVTPSHRFVTEERGLEKIEYIKSDDHLVLMGNPLTEISWKCPKEIHHSNEFVELIGWAVTEGNYTLGLRTHSVQIFQKEGVNADRIRELLELNNAKYKEYIWDKKNDIIGWRITKDIANLIFEYAPNKILSTPFINSLDQKQRMILIKSMIDGDGWIRPYNGSYENATPWSYTQKDKNHIDTFLMLCTLAGLTTTTSLRENKSKFSKNSYYVVNIYAEPKYTCRFENVDLNGGRSSAGGINGKENNPNIPTVSYKGTVWCPKTEYGTFICRRNGQIYITGNTYRDEMISDSNYKMIRALNQKKYDPTKGNPFAYFTKITCRAFINVIKKEKRVEDTIGRYQTEMYDELSLTGLNIGNIVESMSEEYGYE